MKKYIICLTFLFAGLGAYAQSESMPFTRIQRDPVTAAMGGGGYAYTGSIAYGSWNNIAAVPFSQSKFDVAAGYEYWQPSLIKTNAISAGFGFNIKEKIGVSAGLTYGVCPPYEEFDESNNPAGTFTPAEIQANVGVSWRFVKFMSVGVNAHYALQTISADTKLNMFSVDALLMGKVSDFTITAGAMNLGPKIKDGSGGKWPIPSCAVVGAAYSKSFGIHGVDALVDADYYFAGKEAAVHVGAGYTFKEMLSVRAGYQFSQFMPSHVSLGLGFSIAGLHIDAAYMLGTDKKVADMANPMTNTFLLGVGYKF